MQTTSFSPAHNQSYYGCPAGGRSTMVRVLPHAALTADRGTVLAQALKDAQLLQHACVQQVYSLVERPAADSTWCVLEAPERGTLLELLQRSGRLSVETRVALCRDVALGECLLVLSTILIVQESHSHTSFPFLPSSNRAGVPERTPRGARAAAGGKLLCDIELCGEGGLLLPVPGPVPRAAGE